LDKKILKSNQMFSPLDQFETYSLFSFTAPILGNFNISLTNLGLYTIIIFTIIVGLHSISNNNFALIPSSYSIALESLFATITSIVRNQIGENKEVYIPLIYSLFIFVLISNLVSNVAYNFAVTSSVIVCLGISVTIWMGVTILALNLHGLKFFGFFVPAGTPLALVPLLVLIELVSYLARAVSLGLRLFANIVSGHCLLAILSSFLYKLFTTSLLIFVITLIPFVIFLAILGLELAVSFIQAYVFTLLIASYIKDASYLH
jgi:F-type H+-transporting ATPase subunit a